MLNCGLYLTTVPLPGINQGELVYYHCCSIRDAPPGVHRASHWENNKAIFDERRVLVTAVEEASLRPLLPEGLYVVRQGFVCCPRKCREFSIGLLVQLGYRRDGTAILFDVYLGRRGVGLPDVGTKVTQADLEKLEEVKTHPTDVHGPLCKPNVQNLPELTPGVAPNQAGGGKVMQ